MKSIHLITTRCEGIKGAVYVGGRALALHAGLKSHLPVGQDNFAINNSTRGNT